MPLDPTYRGGVIIYPHEVRMKVGCSTYSRLLIVVSTVCLSILISSIALGQGNAGEPSKEVRQLNDQAVDAIVKEDYSRAISLLDESLLVGEWNVTYLNLGRAYQLVGSCEKAQTALKKARTAPPVNTPRKELVVKKANKYLAELAETCDIGAADSEEAAAESTDDESSVASEAEPEEASDSDDADSDERSSEVRNTEASEMTDVTAEPEAERAGAGSSAASSILLATGAGGLVAGGVFAFLARQQAQRVNGADVEGDVHQITEEEAFAAEQKASTFNTIALSSSIAGVALMGIGTVWLVTSKSGAAESELSLGPTSGGAHIQLNVRF